MANRDGHRQFGNIRQLPSGRFQARYTGPDGRPYSAKKDGRSVTFETKGDAQAWLKRCRELIDHGEWSATGAVKVEQVRTLREYSATWMAGRKLRARTRELYRRHLDTHILPRFGDTPLTLIGPEDVDAWYATLGTPRKDGNRVTGGPTAQAHSYGLLRTIMRTAEQRDLIIKNPCRVDGGSQTKRKITIKPATVAELEAIVNAIPGKYKLLVLLAAWCALRFGELAELRRSDIDLKNGVVRVRRGVVRLTGEGRTVNAPKSDAGIRDVAIPSHLHPAIKAHLAEHAAPGPDGLLFPSTTHGQQLAESTMRRVYYPARAKAGRPDLRFHDLRHTGATMAAETGATLAQLMHRLGHSNPAAAMRYQHATDGADRIIADRLSARATGNLAATTPV